MGHQHLKSHNCYQNCAFYGPDDELMFRCSRKRAAWYLKRDLAEVISEEPLRLRLKFEPQGRGHAGNLYYLSQKVNRCVVCGAEEHLTKHHVVPSCYRRFFPEKIKSRTSYDVFLVCVKHHEEYEAHAWRFKCELGAEYEVPMAAPKESPREAFDKDLMRACRAANALARYGFQIPEGRKEQLRESLIDYVEENESVEEAIQRLAKILEDGYHKKRKSLNIEVNFGAEVVARVSDVQEFIRRWRRHFVTAMNPKFLPEHWKIEKDWRGY